MNYGVSVILVFSTLPFVFAQEYPELNIKVETVAENLNIPWSIVWDPEGTIFFTERPGDLRTIKNGGFHCDNLIVKSN